MQIRSEHKKGISYAEIAKKYNIDPRTAKKYALSDSKPVYELSEPKPSITERKRSEAASVEVVQEAFVQGVSTRKIEKLANRLGIENLSRSQVIVMTKGLNEQVETFRNRPLSDTHYPVLWVDALYEKMRFNGRVVSMAVLIVCAVNSEGKREVLSIEPMLEESAESYTQRFTQLKSCGLATSALIVSDAHAGLVGAIRQSFPGAS